MRIVQLLPAIAHGDAVGNDTLALRNIIRSMGYLTDIYAEHIGFGMDEENIIHCDEMLLDSKDVLIYHMAIGSRLTYLIENLRCKKIAIYHNITPSSYFLGYSPLTYSLTKKGLEEIRYLKDKFDYCLADSEYNKNDLISYGYTCDIDVLPIAVPFADYEKKPSGKILRKYANSLVNLLFVGRVAPNKKFEDLIAAFYHYHKKYNQMSRLFLVGNWRDMERYYEKLCEYVKMLGLNNVIFTGHVKFDEILSYYKLADVFLCMSEHEGFCVPLVEAMFFDIPIVACAHAAVPKTLGSGGIVLDQPSPLLAAGVINALMTNPELRKQIINKQQERLKDFSYETVKAQFILYLKKFLGSVK